MSQGAFFSVCDNCGEEHSDGNWMLCHACAGPAFRAWYVAGWRCPASDCPVCGPNYADACAIFAGMVAAMLWTS